MNLKLVKISVKSTVLILTIINFIAGFILGAVVTIVALVAPDEQTPGGIGPWAILVFPILNGLLGAATAALLTGLFNVLAKRVGGIGLEFENTP